MLKYILIVVTSLCLNFSTQAEIPEHVIQIMSSEDAQFVPFAVVYIKELDQEVTANAKGEITLPVQSKRLTLLVASLGYKEMEVSVAPIFGGFSSVFLSEAEEAPAILSVEK